MNEIKETVEQLDKIERINKSLKDLKEIEQLQEQIKNIAWTMENITKAIEDLGLTKEELKDLVVKEAKNVLNEWFNEVHTTGKFGASMLTLRTLMNVYENF